MDRDRLPNDLFFDPDVVGAVQAEATPAEAEPFFTGESDARRGDLQHGLGRLASRPYAFAGTLAALGFVAVFILQMPLLYQLVFGAPIFEEAVKFGLALLLAYPLRYAALRVPVALAVGGAFGVLEHFVTYAEEGATLFVGRILFHGGATALSMAAFQVLQAAVDPRARFAATLPATLVHYLNNAGALALAPVSLVSEDVGSAVSLAWSGGLVAVLYVLLLWMLASGARYRDGVVRWLRRKQVQAGASSADRRS